MFPPWTSRFSAPSAAKRLPVRMTFGATSRAWAVPASSAIFATAPRYGYPTIPFFFVGISFVILSFAQKNLSLREEIIGK